MDTREPSSTAAEAVNGKSHDGGQGRGSLSNDTENEMGGFPHTLYQKQRQIKVSSVDTDPRKPWGNISKKTEVSQVTFYVKNLSDDARDVRDTGSIPWWGRCTRGGHGNPLQYSSLEYY